MAIFNISAIIISICFVLILNETNAGSTCSSEAKDKDDPKPEKSKTNVEASTKVFEKIECEKNILKVFPEKTAPKNYFLHAFENFSIKHFEEIIEMNNDAQGYFEDLLQRKRIKWEQSHMTPKQFCESNYKDENAIACIRVIRTYFNCPQDTLAITAVTILYNNIIYEHIPEYYGTGYGENPIPSDYDPEITKKKIGMLEEYFKYIQEIADSTTDYYFQTIQQYCDPQYFKDIPRYPQWHI